MRLNAIDSFLHPDCFIKLVEIYAPLSVALYSLPFPEAESFRREMFEWRMFSYLLLKFTVVLPRLSVVSENADARERLKGRKMC